MLGHSEFFLRLPCVLAGTLFCWIMFCWLRQVTDSSTALIALALLLFSPAVIQLSAEVRQYSFLLLFCAASLYWLERALVEDSIPMLCASGISLYLALLTHYSSFLFAVTLGLYALTRFATSRVRGAFMLSWAGVQALGIALASLLYTSHLSKIRHNGMADAIVDTYLSRSVLHPGQNALWFIGRSNLRLFHYFFSQGAVGVVALLFFVAGIVLLLRDDSSNHASRQPSGRQLAFLFCFPLIVNCGLALFRAYPYGGTRHNAYLAIVIMPAIAIALARWKPVHAWWKSLFLVVVLIACNALPAPVDQYIRIHNQRRQLMAKAVAELRSSPSNSIIFTDDQGGLLLSYYLCGSRVAQIEQSPFQPYMRSRCGDHWVISIDPDWWIFKAETFPDTFRGALRTYDLRPGTSILLFQAGWFIDKEYALREELKQYGCAVPHDFGRNMFICPLTVGGG
jgi:4-amino-4-deoxy-L-arabinose transferase-like glycosyltransferase